MGNMGSGDVVFIIRCDSIKEIEYIRDYSK